MNPNLQRLEPYPFAKLQALLSDLTPPTDKSPIALSIGEPQHAPPAFVLKVIENNLHRLANYPTTGGLPELRQAIADIENRASGKHWGPATPSHRLQTGLLRFFKHWVLPLRMVRMLKPFGITLMP